jgi:hypothetical protein
LIASTGASPVLVHADAGGYKPLNRDT